MVFYTYNGKTYTKFYTYSQLINWIAQHTIPYIGTDWDNGFLRYCGNNSNDVVHYHDWRTGANITIARTYRIYNEDWHSIFNSKIVADVREATYNATMEAERKQQELNDTAWQNELRRAGYLRSRKHRWWEHTVAHKTRRWKLGAPKRDWQYAADPDHAPYIRPKRNLRHLPNAYDDLYSRNSSGWKHSTKYRHQWEAKARQKAAREIQRSFCIGINFML